MSDTATSDRKWGLIVEVALFVAVLSLLGVSEYLHNDKSSQVLIVTQSAKPTPTPSATPTSTPAPTPGPATIYSIPELGLLFALPASMADLTHTTVHLTGDQAVNSVGFGSNRLQSAGCSLASAPLGYLTYDTDKGGAIVGHARGHDLYYLDAKTGCNAEAALRDSSALKAALGSLTTDTASEKTSR